MAAQQSQITLPELTEFAKKYGAQQDSHKSYLTPLDLPYPKSAYSIDESKKRAAALKFQQRKFWKFSSKDLLELDAISDRELPAATLGNYIHPILQRSRWLTRPATPAFTIDHLYDLKNGRGKWVMHNPEVERIMLPSLKLASRMLTALHVLPWYNAIMNGPRRVIPNHRRRPKDVGEANYISFHAAPIHDSQAVIDQREKTFEQLMNQFDLKLGFCSIEHDPRGPHFDNLLDENRKNPNGYAVTLMNDEQMQEPKNQRNKSIGWGIWIFLKYERIETLFRSDLNTAERMCIEWEVASTLYHEVMHAFGIPFFAKISGSNFEWREPYFETQAMSELGWAAEFVLHGCNSEPFLGIRGLPLGYWLQTDFPTLKDMSGSGEPILRQPGCINTQTSYPVPVTTWSMLQQEDFWTIVSQAFQRPLLRYITVNECSKTTYSVSQEAIEAYDIDSDDERPLATAGEYTRLFNAPLGDNLNILALTPDQKQSLAFAENIFRMLQANLDFRKASQMGSASVRQIDELLLSIQGKSISSEVLDLLANRIHDLIEKHKDIIISLESLQRADNDLHTNHIRSLLIWNKGIRIFTTELYRNSEELDGTPARQTLFEDKISLEHCRLRLFNPTMTIQNLPDINELATLQHARAACERDGDVQAIQASCTAVINANGVSILAETCAQTVILALEANEYMGWAGRVDNLEKYVGVLARLQSGSSGWNVLITDWMQWGTRVVQYMRSQFEGR